MPHRWFVILVLLLVTAASGCAVEISERKLIHPVTAGAVTEESIAKAAPAYALTRHEIIAPDGVRLRGIHLHQPDARVTVLYFGGNGYTIGRYGARTASTFAPLGVDLFITDHRGYGQSEGTPTAATMAIDALTIFDYVAKLPDVGADRIVVHGHSLGSFLAGFIAAHRSTAGVVLEGSATTTEDWVKVRTPGVAKPFV